MSDDIKTNLEILSKIVIQLKSEQKDIIKNLKAEIEELKVLNASSAQRSQEVHHIQIQNLTNEIADLKKVIKIQDEKNFELYKEMEIKLDKTDKDLRDDMLRLLRKYESKFQTQDDEIENLKEKCEMGKCAYCDFESFKVHFKLCPLCEQSVCLSCLKNCKKCDEVKCAKCLCECNTCLELFCESNLKDENQNENNINENTENKITKNNNDKLACISKCKLCQAKFCQKCNLACFACKSPVCKRCLLDCRICNNAICTSCCKKCDKCTKAIICSGCFAKSSEAEKCFCGKTLCFDCEDECSDCNIPFTFLSNSRVFTGFHTRSQDFLPSRCIIKLFIANKGIDTTHIGLTVDAEFLKEEKATENFWSLCLNTGEKFSTIEYKKKGVPWANYAVPIKTGDFVYLRFYDGEVRFMINRKDFGRAFLLDAKNHKYFLYCLTHNDSTKVVIRSMKIFNTGNNNNV